MSRVEETPDEVDNTEHDTAMANKADESGVQIKSGSSKPDSEETTDVRVDESTTSSEGDEGKPQRPDNVPEKFWDAEKGEVKTEALLESYRQLESSKSKPEGDDSGESEGDDGGESEGDEESGEDSSDQETAIAKAQSEYDESGELSEDTLKALEDSGIDRGTVQAYIAGMEATRMLAFQSAGGEEQYNQMIQWASKNLSEAEVKAYDEALSGSPKDIVAAVEGLSKRFNAEGHHEGRMVEGNNNKATTPEGFKSKGEMVQAMKDPRYSSDSAYRAEVERKIAAATRAGVNLTM